MDFEYGESSKGNNVTDSYYVVGNVIYFINKSIDIATPNNPLFTETPVRGMYVIKDDD